jgi:hypothetical protein
MKMEQQWPEFNADNIQWYSFWKPELISPEEDPELLSMGTVSSVGKRLLDVPKMTQVRMPPRGIPSALNFHWQVGRGVALRIHSAPDQPIPGEVFTISVKSATSANNFYRLYVQIYEHLGAMLLDECQRTFVTPRDFRLSLV